MKTISVILVLIISMLLSNCRGSDDEQSNLDWAHIPLSFGYENLLINVPPQQTIRVCGELQEMTIWAIKRWAAVINRDQHLNIVPCNRAGLNSITVQVSIDYCQGAAFAHPEQRLIRVCPDISNLGPDFSHVILHEVGHLWGLCDLYSPNFFYCDQLNSSGVDPNALMMGGHGSARDIQPDDVRGLVALSRRPEFPANRIWEQFLTQNQPTPDQALQSCKLMGIDYQAGSEVTVGGQVYHCQNGTWQAANNLLLSSCQFQATAYREGDVIYDGNNFYSCENGNWNRLPLVMAMNQCPR